MDLPEVELGRTGLRVRRLGLGGGRGISSPDLRYAFRKGINYFFWSSDLHHHIYQKQVAAIRSLFDASVRDRHRVVLATATYTDHPEKVFGALRDQLLELRLDYVDVFFWGWVVRRPTKAHRDMICALKDRRLATNLRHAMTAWSHDYLGPADKSEPRRRVTVQVANEIKSRGWARFVGASFHDRALSRSWLESDLLDVVMLRYNPAHRGLERSPGDLLRKIRQRRPGTVCFNTTAGVSDQAAFSAVRHTDLYRFAWALPYIDVVLAGLNSRQQIDEAVAACAKTPLSDEERAHLRALGDRVRASQHSPS